MNTAPNRLYVHGLFILSLLLGVGVYWQSWESMVAIWWRSDTYAHGMMIGPISLWLIYRQRQQLRLISPRPSLLGVLSIALAGLLWWLAYTAGVLVGEHFAVVLMVISTVLAFYGRAIVSIIAFALFYLLFMVPVGESLVPPLMDFTAEFTVWALDLSDIPVYMEGRYLQLTSGTFEVAEACSGLRYLIASVALGALYAHLSYRSWWRQGLFMIAAIVVPILANGVRAYGIVIIAHSSDMKYAVGMDHLIYGWLFFGLVMALLFWLGSLWQENTPTNSANLYPDVLRQQRVSAGRISLIAVLAMAAISTGAALHYGLGTIDSADAPVAVNLPPARDGWRLVSPEDDWQPRFEGVSAVARQDYQKEGKRVRVFVGVYQKQQQGAELINSANSLYDPRRWLRVDETQLATIGALKRARHVIDLSTSSTRARLSYWYRVSGRLLTDDVLAKLWMPWGLVSDQRESTVVAFMVDYQDQASEADAVLQRFLEAHDFLDPGLVAEGASTQQDAR